MTILKHPLVLSMFLMGSVHTFYLPSLSARNLCLYGKVNDSPPATFTTLCTLLQSSRQRQDQQQQERVLVTPHVVPNKNKASIDYGSSSVIGSTSSSSTATPSSSLSTQNKSSSSSRPSSHKPNWVFMYPQPCSSLLDDDAAITVGSFMTKTISPDNCQGGYYGAAAEDLDPLQVMQHGLPRRGTNWDLLNHVLQRGNSAFRGTTKQIVYPEDGVGAAAFAGEGGYVYELTCVPSWDVNKHLQGRRQVGDNSKSSIRTFGGNLVLGEHEFAVPSRVPSQHIKRYGRVVRSVGTGTLFVPRTAWVENPRWNPAFCKYSISDTACFEIRTLLDEMDTDGNGTLDMEEFRVLFRDATKSEHRLGTTQDCCDDVGNPQWQESDVESMFQRFDTNQSGSITTEELRQFLMQYGKSRCL